MSIVEYPFKLTSCTWLSKSVKQFRGEIQAKDWHFIPGQFITLLFEHEGKILKRSYSIANAPQGSTIEFAAAYVEGGPGSEFLFKRQVGDVIQMAGPYGRLIIKPNQDYQRLVLVATSTGITPYRSMLAHLEPMLKQNSGLKLEIIQGVKTQKDVLYAEDFMHFCQRFPQQAKFTVALSRETQALSVTHFPIIQGHVQDVLADKQLEPTQDLIYLCGNPQMIDDTTKLLEEKNFSIQQIIREKYISR